MKKWLVYKICIKTRQIVSMFWLVTGAATKKLVCLPMSFFFSLSSLPSFFPFHLHLCLGSVYEEMCHGTRCSALDWMTEQYFEIQSPPPPKNPQTKLHLEYQIVPGLIRSTILLHSTHCSYTLSWSRSVARSHRVAVGCYLGAPYSLKSTVSETRRNCYRSLGLF